METKSNVTDVLRRREETPGMCTHRGKTMCGHSKKAGVSKPKKKGRKRNLICQHLDLELLASRTMSE